MKSKDFHNQIVKAGWKFLFAKGSHYRYIKDGKISPPIPFHGSQEMREGLRLRIIKEMGL